MILTIIEQDVNTVCAIPAVLNELAIVPATMQAHAKAMQKLFDRYAKGGRQQLTTALFHEADREHGIWEFTHGRLRVFCFMDNGALIVLAAFAIKKTQKADSAGVRRAISVRDQYLDAKQACTLQFNQITKATQ